MWHWDIIILLLIAEYVAITFFDANEINTINDMY